MKRFILLLAAVAFLFTVPLSTYSIADAAPITHHHYVKKHKKHHKHYKKHIKKHHRVKRHY